MSERLLLKQKRQGGVESLPLLYREFGETKEQAIERRKVERDAAVSRIQNLSARQLLKRMEAMQTGRMLQLAGQNLSVMQSAGSAPIIVAPSSTSSTSNVNQRFDLGMPASADTERLTVD